MRARWFRTYVATILVACSGPGANRPPSADDRGEPSAQQLAQDDEYQPTYSPAELGRALIAERGKEATAERVVTELERTDQDAATNESMRLAVADLAVRRRFIAALETCQASRRSCPPRLDEPAWSFDVDTVDAKPSLDTPLRFDLGTWQKLAAELHGRACACRTLACVDGVGVAIDQLEPRPMREVQGDETASLSVTRARQCLFRLRGKTVVVRAAE